MFELSINDPRINEVVEGARTTVKVNKSWLRRTFFEIDCSETDERFIPRLLVQAGFFESTSQVKKNQPELWRASEGVICEQIRLSWATIEFWFEDC